MKVEHESDTITRISLGKREIILIGTAHMSHSSIDEVNTVIDNDKPDHVCVEIDEARYKTMTEGTDWKKMNIYQVIRQKKGFLLMANLVLSSYQKKIGAGMGITPGEEMMAAVRKAQENNIPFSFADREVHVTLSRAWRKSSWWNKNKLMALLVSSIFSREKLTEDDIEKLKKKSALEDMMDEMAGYLPSIKSVLIDERDRFLATRIFQAPGNKTVAVVGAGHANGIVEWLRKLYEENESTDLEDINVVPAKHVAGKIIPWIIPLAVLGIIAYGFVTAGWEDALDKAVKWIVYNGVLAAIGAIVGLAHPIVIVLSFPFAPIFSLNPFMGTGIVCGVIESLIRKPRVMDFENLNTDIQSFKGFYRNRLTHALVVMITISLGSLVGSFTGLFSIL
ncbi:MAG: TraB/GumN family protein [Spirochaetales bacterium]|nr:TraB/GumN family protein [Spirochaetales bacterium]